MSLLIIRCRDSLFDYLLAYEEFLAAILFNWTLSPVRHQAQRLACALSTLNLWPIWQAASHITRTMDRTIGCHRNRNSPYLFHLPRTCCVPPASRAYVERVFSVCGDLTSGKRNRLTKKLENRAFLTVNYQYYARALLWTTFSLLQRKNLNVKMDLFKFCACKKWKVCCYYSLCIFVKKSKITVTITEKSYNCNSNWKKLTVTEKYITITTTETEISQLK